jgi:hypothetical protein
MPACKRALLLAAALAGAAPHQAPAQASPYIPLDDPLLPILEHLIIRGDIEDPSPLIRPFRRVDALRALDQADSSGAATQLLERLREELRDPPGSTTWSLSGQIGAQTYTHARRDLLHPAGPDGVRPFAELAGWATFGNVVLVTRPLAEPRLTVDPDWPGRPDLEFTGRIADGYISGQFKYGNIFYGQMDRNWGPTGLPGIPLSNYGYERQGLAFDLGTSALRLSALATDLQDEVDSLGQTVHRYYFVHRLAVRPSRRLFLAAWEGVLLAGAGRNFETRYRNPLSLSYLANTIGLGDKGNVLLGLDLRWRAFHRATLEAQLAIDDFQYQNRNDPGRLPDRWALTLGASGPLGRAFGWRALYTQASSLAFRTFNPFESFVDNGVGIGRNFSDMDQLTFAVSLPVRQRWLVAPDLTFLRQGEGAINAPFPATPLEAGQTPQIFIGVVERTYRLGVSVRGREGPISLDGNAGFHHIVNWRHQDGRTADRVEARIQVTLGLGRKGILR